MQASFKVQFNGKFRRFSLEETTLDNLVSEISKKFSLERSAITISYVDDEGDRININSDFELNEAVQYALPAKCLKLLVDVPNTEVSPQEPLVTVTQQVEEQVISEPETVLVEEAETAETAEPLVEKKLRRKQRVRKEKKQVSRQRGRKVSKREKTLVRREVNKIKKEKRVAKAPRSIKNKKVRSPRPFMTRVIAHVNFPTGQEIAPNVDFVKVWKLRNTGTLAWTPELKVVRVSKGENVFNAPDSVVLNREVSPGAECEINIPMRAPNQPGTYESAWRLVNSEGKRFGQRFVCKLMVFENCATAAQQEHVDPINEKKARSAERKQQRAEKLAKYDAQLTKIRALGMKTTVRHIRLLEKFDGNVDHVIAAIDAKKKAPKLA